MASENPTIKLDQFLKYVGCAQTGGQAKLIIQSGWVLVNDEIETRRGRKLVNGDRVTFEDQTYKVEFSN
ncbi:MAG: RNA-binding S4 domain-containing protein [Cyanobacteriota bacterium]|nr:RNA-binding S4 domain-containing protein [Cyanobacteriota bacterium]